MPTYAFCVLQTFHRLCKTSESVRPLESWGGGTGELTGQRSGLQQSDPIIPRNLRLKAESSRRRWRRFTLTFDLAGLELESGPASVLTTPSSDQSLQEFTAPGSRWSGAYSQPDLKSLFSSAFVPSNS